MARAGILYSQVAATASKLYEKGENPTVDKVRAALGNTGSKSTIAPLLKRWKSEHIGTVPEAQSGLPVELINAVKHLYEQAHEEANMKVAAIEEEMHSTRETFEEERQQSQQLLQSLQDQAAQLKAGLAALQTKHSALENAYNTAQIDNARLQADAAGMQLRLADRQEDIKGLQEQLAQARAQYAGDQQSAMLQREEEQRRFEQSKAALESALATQQQECALLALRVATLDTVEANYKQLQETHAKLAQHVNTQTALAVDLSNRHEATSEALLEAQNELAVLRNERPALVNTNKMLEAAVAASNKELQGLRIEKARLEQQLALATG